MRGQLSGIAACGLSYAGAPGGETIQCAAGSTCRGEDSYCTRSTRYAAAEFSGRATEVSRGDVHVPGSRQRGSTVAGACDRGGEKGGGRGAGCGAGAALVDAGEQ